MNFINRIIKQADIQRKTIANLYIYPDANRESNSFYEISFSINVPKYAPPHSGEK